MRGEEIDFTFNKILRVSFPHKSIVYHLFQPRQATRLPGGPDSHHHQARHQCVLQHRNLLRRPCGRDQGGGQQRRPEPMRVQAWPACQPPATPTPGRDEGGILDIIDLILFRHIYMCNYCIFSKFSS